MVENASYRTKRIIGREMRAHTMAGQRAVSQRPRQTLNFSTPAEILNGALTG